MCTNMIIILYNYISMYTRYNYIYISIFTRYNYIELEIKLKL